MEEQHQQMDPQQPGGADGAPPAVVKVRWKPNEEQLRMLVRLFEEEGDSINKQRIKEIAADLARQGDVTEANVHNWFHNRKARAKRKQKMMQMNDGESEVDTDVDSKGKRTKLDPVKGLPTNGSFGVSEFSDQRRVALRPPLRLPSDGINLNSRMFENSMALAVHQAPGFEFGPEKYRLTEFSHDVVPNQQTVPQQASEAWRSHGLTLHTSSFVSQGVSPIDSLDRSSESKTITDDASTESEAVAESRRWTKSRKAWKKEGKGTMIRRPLERSRHTSGRKSRIRAVLKGLKRNPDTYDRDLKALFVEVVRKIGTSRSRAILSKLTSRRDSSSPSVSFDSSSRSSTASPPRHKVVSCSPAGQQKCVADQYCSDTRMPSDSSFRFEKCIQQRYCCDAAAPSSMFRQELTLSNNYGKATTGIPNGSSSSSDGDGSCPTDQGAPQDEEESEKEDFRIVWSSQKKQQAGGLGRPFSPPQQQPRVEMTDSEVGSRTPQVPTYKKERPAKMKLELAPEGEKTTIVLTDGKPAGPAGSWWNSMLRHSALLFLDVSIPHIALQPEEGLMRIREYMDSKFEYSGGTLDDAYLKKQVAKSLNFRRHKVMRLIEQGAGRPSDVSEDQWDALIKYYADPKRREKSDKQRAALKALNMNNQLHHQQQLQLMAQQAELQQRQREQQVQQQEVQTARQFKAEQHVVRDLNFDQEEQEEQEEEQQTLGPIGEEPEDLRQQKQLQQQQEQLQQQQEQLPQQQEQLPQQQEQLPQQQEQEQQEHEQNDMQETRYDEKQLMEMHSA